VLLRPIESTSELGANHCFGKNLSYLEDNAGKLENRKGSG